MSDGRILIVDDEKMIMLHAWISELPRKSKVNEPDFFVETILFRREGPPPSSLCLKVVGIRSQWREGINSRRFKRRIRRSLGSRGRLE